MRPRTGLQLRSVGTRGGTRGGGNSAEPASMRRCSFLQGLRKDLGTNCAELWAREARKREREEEPRQVEDFGHNCHVLRVEPSG